MQSSMILPVDALDLKGALVDSLFTRLFLPGVVVSPGVFAVVVASLGVAVVVTSLGVTVVSTSLGVAVVVTSVVLSAATIKRGLKLYKVTWFLKLGSFVVQVLQVLLCTTSASTIARYIFCHYWLSA